MARTTRCTRRSFALGRLTGGAKSVETGIAEAATHAGIGGSKLDHDVEYIGSVDGNP